MDLPCGEPILWGISPDFSGLSPCYRWIAYVLLTRAPVAGKGIATSPLPLDLHVLGLSLAFILSQDQTLRCILFFFFIIPSKRHLTELTSFSLLSCTTLASSIPSMNLAKAPRGVPRFLFCGCKVNAFSYSAPNFFTHFLCCTTYFFYNELYYTHLYLNIFFKKNPNTI